MPSQKIALLPPGVIECWFEESEEIWDKKMFLLLWTAASGYSLAKEVDTITESDKNAAALAAFMFSKQILSEDWVNQKKTPITIIEINCSRLY